jgi:hypothetical protein
MNDIRHRFLAAPTFREYLEGVDTLELRVLARDAPELGQEISRRRTARVSSTGTRFVRLRVTLLPRHATGYLTDR